MKRILIANWKMYLTHDQAIEWIKNYSEELDQIIQKTEHLLVILPSLDACCKMQTITAGRSFSIGAQDCSPHELGAYTGQISAQSLEQMNCTHCLIGHSETRSEHNVSDFVVAEKLRQLIATSIIPIICVGENRKEDSISATLAHIETQLKQLITYFDSQKTYYIAYEPLWAIGTGIIPTSDHVVIISNHIRSYIKHHSSATIKVLYGGSVTSETIKQIVTPEIDGFLIGKASTDFQELKKIVNYL